MTSYTTNTMSNNINAELKGVSNDQNHANSHKSSLSSAFHAANSSLITPSSKLLANPDPVPYTGFYSQNSEDSYDERNKFIYDDRRNENEHNGIIYRNFGNSHHSRNLNNGVSSYSESNLTFSGNTSISEKEITNTRVSDKRDYSKSYDYSYYNSQYTHYLDSLEDYPPQSLHATPSYQCRTPMKATHPRSLAAAAEPSNFIAYSSYPQGFIATKASPMAAVAAASAVAVAAAAEASPRHHHNSPQQRLVFHKNSGIFDDHINTKHNVDNTHTDFAAKVKSSSTLVANDKSNNVSLSIKSKANASGKIVSKTSIYSFKNSSPSNSINSNSPNFKQIPTNSKQDINKLKDSDLNENENVQTSQNGSTNPEKSESQNVFNSDKKSNGTNDDKNVGDNDGNSKPPPNNDPSLDISVSRTYTLDPIVRVVNDSRLTHYFYGGITEKQLDEALGTLDKKAFDKITEDEISKNNEENKNNNDSQMEDSLLNQSKELLINNSADVKSDVTLSKLKGKSSNITKFPGQLSVRPEFIEPIIRASKVFGEVKYTGAHFLQDTPIKSRDTLKLFLLPRFTESDIGSIVPVIIPSHHLIAYRNLSVRSRAIWGTEVYTDDSDIVSILIHTGNFIPFPTSKVGNNLENGQQRLPSSEYLSPPSIRCLIRVLPKLIKYTGSLRYGLQSRGWGGSHDGYSIRLEKMFCDNIDPLVYNVWLRPNWRNQYFDFLLHVRLERLSSLKELKIKALKNTNNKPKAIKISLKKPSPPSTDDKDASTELASNSKTVSKKRKLSNSTSLPNDVEDIQNPPNKQQK